jgi:hypothetical protein
MKASLSTTYRVINYEAHNRQGETDESEKGEREVHVDSSNEGGGGEPLTRAFGITS